MRNEILNYFSRTHAQYIHARGEIGTRLLIQVLNCQPNEKVLEIGFGTGTTLLHIYSNNKKTKFYGLEQSPLMYKKARARLNFSLIGKSVKLGLMEQKNKISFPANSFDKIFLESVLGIQECDDFVNLIIEISRVLKPGGILVMNETIWLNTTSVEELLQVNDFCRRSFGVIQCNSEYPYVQNWIDLLTRLNFKCESIIRLDEVKNPVKSGFGFPYRLLSQAYTAIGKIKSSLITSMRKEKKNYYQKMKQINPDNKPLMEGIIIKAVNKK
jgi:SAM-dependent methyltransferase